MHRLTAIPIVLYFLCVGLYGLDRLGLYCDETIFISAARGGADGDFVLGRIFGIPTYIMSYIGALKSWIHAPIFWIFGVDAWTVRVPGILISLLTLLLFAEFVRRQFGGAWALATLLLLGTDPGFLLTSRTDFGPTVLMSFLKALSLLGFFLWLDKPNASRMFFWLVALVLGVWNKLDFLWIVIAFGGAALLLHGKQVLRTCREQGRRAWIPLSFFGVAMLAFALVPIRLTLQASHDSGTPPGFDRFAYLWQIFREAFDGRGMQGFQFPHIIHPGSAVLLLPLAGLLFLPVLWTGRSRCNGLYRWPAFFLLCSLLVLTQVFLTPQAGGAHHMLLLWPFPQLFAISVFAALYRALDKPFGRVATSVSALLILFVVGSQVRVELYYLSLLSQPELMSPKWSPQIYELSRVVEASDAELIVSTDWGIHPQLSSLASTKNRHKYLEIWPYMKTLDPRICWPGGPVNTFTGKRVLFLLHAERTEEQIPARRNTLDFLDEHFPKRKVSKIQDAVGRPLYEMHLVEGR